MGEGVGEQAGLDLGPSQRTTGGFVESGTSKEEWDQVVERGGWFWSLPSLGQTLLPPPPSCPGVSHKSLVLIFVLFL